MWKLTSKCGLLKFSQRCLCPLLQRRRSASLTGAQWRREDAGTTDRGPGPNYVVHFLVLLGIYILSILQINHFRHCPRKSANDSQSFRFSAYLLGGGAFFFPPGPEPVLVDPGSTGFSVERATVIMSREKEAAACHISEESTFKYPHRLLFVK